MATVQWRYFESGMTGWSEITTPYIPNPNSVPIETNLVSTRIEEELADGSMGYITPETKYKYDPVQFTWQTGVGASSMHSGSTIAVKMQQLARDDVKFKIIPHMPDKQWVGKIKSVSEKLILSQLEDYRDVVVTLQPMLDES
jgi:histidinol phosphatase-like enzyme